MGGIPVPRGKGDKTVLEKAVKKMKEESSGMMVFPEGTRSETGELLKLKTGAFMLAAETASDIIPCRIIYDTKTKSCRLFSKVCIKFGEPLKIEDTKLNEATRQSIKDGKLALNQSLENLKREYYENK